MEGLGSGWGRARCGRTVSTIGLSVKFSVFFPCGDLLGAGEWFRLRQECGWGSPQGCPYLRCQGEELVPRSLTLLPNLATHRWFPPSRVWSFATMAQNLGKHTYWFISKDTNEQPGGAQTVRPGRDPHNGVGVAAFSAYGHVPEPEAVRTPLAGVARELRYLGMPD